MTVTKNEVLANVLIEGQAAAERATPAMVHTVRDTITILEGLGVDTHDDDEMKTFAVGVLLSMKILRDAPIDPLGVLSGLATQCGAIMAGLR